MTIHTDIIYNLTGIGSGMVRTHGEVIAPIHNVPVHFQIVDDEFRTKETGILGVSFLEKQEVTLMFKEHLPNSLQFGDGEFSSDAFSSFELPPRTKALIAVPTYSKCASGYMRRIDLGSGIYMGEVLARSTVLQRYMQSTLLPIMSNSNRIRRFLHKIPFTTFLSYRRPWCRPTTCPRSTVRPAGQNSQFG